MTPEQKLQEAAMMAFPESESRANRAFNFATSPAAQEYWQGEKESIIQELLTALEASNDLLVKNSYGEEREEANYQLIQKLKV